LFGFEKIFKFEFFSKFTKKMKKGKPRKLNIQKTGIRKNRNNQGKPILNKTDANQYSNTCDFLLGRPASKRLTILGYA
jgi:hypothetical protein